MLDTKFTEFQVDDSYRTEQVFVEFIGYIKIPKATNKVTFQTECDQGSRFYLNLGGDLINVIDSWNNPSIKQSKTFNVKPNSFIPFKLEYFLDIGRSTIRLSWKLNEESRFTIISRDNYFLDSEQCNRLTNIPDFNTLVDTQFKTYPGISGINSFDRATMNSNRLGNFDTVDECAIICNNNDNCKAFTYNYNDKSCYKFDPSNPKFSKNENTNTYIKNNTTSIYGSYDNSLEVPMRKMITITNSNNRIKLNGLNDILKRDFTIEMYINVREYSENISLFTLRQSGETKGNKIIFNLNKLNDKLEVDFGYPTEAIDVIGEINPNQNQSSSINTSANPGAEYFADYQTPDINLNVWTHVAMSYSNNIVKIFVNGQKKSEVKQGPYVGLDNNASAYIGVSYDEYKMNVDEIRIWSKALDETTLKSFMNKEVDSAHPDKNNLVWYSNLNFIENKQIYNKCTNLIGSGCNQSLKAVFNQQPIVTTSNSPFA